MINIVVNYKTKEVKIEGHDVISIETLNSNPDGMVNLIKIILNKAYYSRETLCLETRDEIGYYHEVNRWP